MTADGAGPGGAGAGGYRHFHEQLATLKQQLLAMSDQAESLVETSVEALLDGDDGKATLVIDGDRALDAMEIEVEQAAIQLLALQQPMARDLRFLVGTIRVTSDLERVGDHAVNIAQGARRLIAARHRLASGHELEEMARRAQSMLADALDAFTRGDGQLGRAVCRADDAVDTLYGSIFRRLSAEMMADSAAIPAALELLLVSRNLERVADLATNIAEDAVFIAEGKQIKHRAELRAS